MKDDLREFYKKNLFKIMSFSPLLKFMKKEISPLIALKIKEYNLTKTEISSACTDLKNKQLKSKIEAMILSFLYLFIDENTSVIGAGKGLYYLYFW